MKIYNEATYACTCNKCGVRLYFTQRCDGYTNSTPVFCGKCKADVTHLVYRNKQ